MFRVINRILNYATSLGGYAHPELRLFLRYSVGGGLAGIADIVVVSGLVELARLHPLAAGAISLVFGVAINFSVARYWAFKSTEPLLKQFSAFMTVALVGTAINYGSYALMVSILHWWYLLSRVLAIIIAWMWNYGMNRRVTFKTVNSSRLGGM
jgi:putative flippase GtrA